jgi:hypothetical protein
MAMVMAVMDKQAPFLEILFFMLAAVVAVFLSP